MGKWLRRIRGTIGMGITWALGWSIAGVLIGFASILLPWLPWYLFFEVFDAPLPAFAIPGFFAGVFFSVVLGVVGHRRRFRDLSLPRFAAWGAVGGVLLTLFPFALEVLGMASREGSRLGTWHVLAVISGPFIALSAISASVTLLVARRAEEKHLGELDGRAAPTSLGEGAADDVLAQRGSGKSTQRESPRQR